jgi:hypothetical protein
MDHPLWMLAPWAVFSIAIGVKFWRFTGLVRRQLRPEARGTEDARQQLERLWRKDQRAA